MVDYGTHLTYRIQQYFLKEKGPFSAKEMALLLSIEPTDNALRRIRRSFKELENQKFIKWEWQTQDHHSHILTKKFTLVYESEPA